LRFIAPVVISAAYDNAIAPSHRPSPRWRGLRAKRRSPPARDLEANGAFADEPYSTVSLTSILLRVAFE